MATLAKLLVELGMDPALFSKGVARAKSDLQGLDEKARAVGRSVADVGQKAFLRATLPIAAASTFAIGQASDLAEAQSAVSTVYGDSASSIKGYTGSVAKDLGLSRAEALSAATGFGVYAKGAGLASEGAAGFSNDLVGASADLASFYNVAGGVPQVLDDIKSGLSGESEPLRKYGILLSDAAIQQYALENGIWDGTGAMSEQQKVLARHGFVMANLGDAQGDFARTQDGIANRWRVLKARGKDIAAIFGKALMPAFEQAATWAERFAGVLERLLPGMLTWIVVIAGAVAAIGPLLMVLGYLTMAFGAILTVLGLLFSPIGLVIALIALLAYAFRGELLGAIKEAWERGGEFVEDFVDMFARLRDAGESLPNAAIRAFGSALEDLTGIEMSGWFFGLAGGVDELVGAVGRLVSSVLSGDWRGALDALGDIGTIVVNGALELGGMLKDWAGNLGGWVKRELLGTSAVGDGTGGPMGAADSIPWGDAIVVGGLRLGGMLAAWAGNIWGFVRSRLVSSTQTGDGTGGPGMQGQVLQLGNWTLELPDPGMEVTASDVVGWVDSTLEQIIGIDVELQSWKLRLANPDNNLTVMDIVGWVDGFLEKVVGVEVELQSWKLTLANPDGDVTAMDAVGWIDEKLESLTGIDVELQNWKLSLQAPSEVDTPTLPDLVKHIDDSLEAMVGIDVELQNWKLDVGNPVNIDLGFDAMAVIGWIDKELEGLVGVDIEFQDWDLSIGMPNIDWGFSPSDIVNSIVDYIGSDDVTAEQARVYRMVTGSSGAGGDLTTGGKSGQFGGKGMDTAVGFVADTADFDAKFAGLQADIASLVDAPARATFDADTGPFARKYTDAMSWGEILEGTTWVATMDADTGPAAIAYSDVMNWGGIYDDSTFTGTFAGDTGPAAVAYSDVSKWGSIWERSTHTATFAVDHGPAAVAYTQAFGWGNTWASQTFTARFSVDTSGLAHAVDVARWAAQTISDLMPHSPAKKGPLRKEPSFAYIADIAARDLAPLPGILSTAMGMPVHQPPRLPNAIPGLADMGRGSTSDAPRVERPIYVIALKSDEYLALLQKAERGANLAETLGPELGRWEGV